MNRSRGLFLVFAIIAFVILCGLGTWQIFRLQTKLAQIAAIDARIAAPAIPLASALDRQARGENVEYLRVTATGGFLDAPDLRKLAIFEGGAGIELIAPLLTTDKLVILVDRGVIPATAAPESIRPAPKQEQTLEGILRLHDRGRGYFDPDNSPETNQWNWWDIPAMLGAVPVPADAKVSNLILQLLPDEKQQVPPFPDMPKAELRNNHLGYAITWFGLAAALAAVTFVYLRRKPGA